MWLDGGIKLLLADYSQAVLVENSVISLIMFLFAIFSICAFPPSQLNTLRDPRPYKSCSRTIEMLMDIRTLKRKRNRRHACMNALVRFHRDCELLDLDGDGMLEEDELKYLCEVVGVADSGVYKEMMKSMGGKLNMFNRDDTRQPVFPNMEPPQQRYSL